MSTQKIDDTEVVLLLQAELDGELDAATAAAVNSLVCKDADLALMQNNLLQLHQILSDEPFRTSSLYKTPSQAFRNSLRERISAESANSLAVTVSPLRKAKPKRAIRWLAGSMALVTFVVITLILVNVFSKFLFSSNALRENIVTEHVRSLQVEHLLDIASSDRHAVKPWFNGKLDYTPPVIDFSQDGFPLTGGRLAYIAHRNVAVLVYQHGPHPINLFVWPEPSNVDSTASCSQKSGYNLCRWHQNKMVFWAISDMSQDEMNKFVVVWQKTN